MRNRLKNFVIGNFGLVLLVAALLGLIIPEPGKIAPTLILCLLFIIIFSSFFQFGLSFQIVRQNAVRAIFYCLLRFGLVPLLIFYILLPFSLYYAFALFFLAMMPAGTSSAVIGGILGGNYNLSILILVISNFLIVFTIPLLAPVYSRKILIIDQWGLFKTLLLTIILPFFVHLPFRRSKSISTYFKDHLSFIVIVCLSLIFCIAVARNNHTILNELGISIRYFLVSFALYAALYLVGWYVSYSPQVAERISCSVSSGLNNVGLAISLSTIYLSPEITLLFIYAEFAWVVMLIVARRIMPYLNTVIKL